MTLEEFSAKPQEFRAAISDKATELEEEEAKDLSEVKVFEVELWRHEKDQWAGLGAIIRGQV
jgi:hypothetical protein